MANYSNLKAAIEAAIKTNGNQEITGQVLQDVLTSIVSVIGANYTFAGVATPSTNPGTPDQNLTYLAMEGGTYTNFNGTVLPAGISLLMWNGTWMSETVMYGDGGVFDISVYKSSGGTLATFADLSAALDGGNNIPASARKGGMSVKFVQSSDNNYVQFRLMKNVWSINEEDWFNDTLEILNLEKEFNDTLKSILFLPSLNGSDKPGLSAAPYWVDEKTQRILHTGTITGLYVDVTRVGTVSIVKGTMRDWELVETITVNSTGLQKIMFSTPLELGSNEWIGIGKPNDTILWKFNTNNNDEPFYNDNGYFNPNNNLQIGFLGKGIEISGLKNEIDNLEKVIDEVLDPFLFLPSLNGTDTPVWTAAPYWVEGAIQAKLHDSAITGLYVDVTRVGTVSIVKGTMRDWELVETITVNSTGLQKIMFSTPLELGSNEWIGIGKPNDTILWKFNTNNNDEPFYNDNGYFNPNNNLQIGFLGKIGIPDKRTSSNPFEDKKIAIIGDSISTFSGWLPPGYPARYPDSDVVSVDLTWWYQALVEYLRIPVNNINNCAWDGSMVCGDSESTTNGFAACSTKRITDLSRLGNPDIVLIFISCNDWATNKVVGDWNVNSAIPSEGLITDMRSAYALMINKIHIAYPNARVFCFTILDDVQRDVQSGYPPTNQNGVSVYDWNKNIFEITEALGCDVINMHDCGINYANLSTYTFDGLHPNKAGMKLMARKVASELIAKY